MVGEGTAGDLINPRSKPLGVAQAREAGLDPQVDLLQHVARVVRIRQATEHERSQMTLDLGPYPERARRDHDAGPLNPSSSSVRSIPELSAWWPRWPRRRCTPRSPSQASNRG